MAESEMKQQFPSAHPSSACAVDPHESHPPFLPLARVTFCYPRNLPYCQRPPRLDVAFSGVSTGHLTLFFDSTRLCGKSRPEKADSIIHCQPQAAATARYFAFFPCLLFFLRRAAISPRKKEARADEKGGKGRERGRESERTSASPTQEIRRVSPFYGRRRFTRTTIFGLFTA